MCFSWKIYILTWFCYISGVTLIMDDEKENTTQYHSTKPDHG